MSAIAHLPGATWAAAHRALLLAVFVVTVTVTLAVLLTTRTSTSGSTPVPELPPSQDVCPGWTPGTLC
jgi:hypothetical protein